MVEPTKSSILKFIFNNLNAPTPFVSLLKENVYSKLTNIVNRKVCDDSMLNKQENNENSMIILIKLLKKGKKRKKKKQSIPCEQSYMYSKLVMNFN